VGCATTLPPNVERTPSTALANPEQTELGGLFQAELAAHPGESGASIISTGEWGFRARAGLATSAEKTLDLQYYIWDTDTTGKLLGEKLMRAADRGVRVRILLDDINTAETDFQFALLDLHHNIEIRLFNPFADRKSRVFNLLSDLKRLNHRMHNKAFIVDNAVAIVGGRNIGDSYFGVDTASNFRDLDLVMVGPVVQEISRSFDEYWNSEQTFPINLLVEYDRSPDELPAVKAQFYRWAANIQSFPYPTDDSKETLLTKLEALRGGFVWAKATALYDPPDKLESGGEQVLTELREEGRDKERELLLESAYFIAGEDGIERARLNRAQGIHTRVLTNSMATNDVAAAHAGYARYRKDLINSGVELYELKPDAPSIKENWSWLAGTSKASLHTKASVQDREKVVIGSFNLDPRSVALNTEIVIVVESPELAAQVMEYMDIGTRPENSYRLILEPDEKTGGERLVWITEENGQEVRYYSDPETGIMRRFGAWFMSMLPIEKHL
jgi:putative cardiolipin synthase